MNDAAIVPVITNAGRAAIVRAQGDGLQADISHIAIGRGPGPAGGGYVPTAAATALYREDARAPLLSGERIDGGFRVLARFPEVVAGTASLPVWEVGFVLSTGAMLAVWSHTEAWPLTFRTPLAGVDLAFELHLAQVPLDALRITVTEPDIPDLAAAVAEGVALSARELTQEIGFTGRRFSTLFGA